jgi:hypothetical protein
MTTFTERALSAQIINEHEAEAMEAWIDDNCMKDSAIVPAHLKSLWDRVNLFNFNSEVTQ